MQGINSYEDILRNPGLSIINWEFISIHPEAKLAIWQRYQTDASFRVKIDTIIATNINFRTKFEEHFNSYKEQTRGR